MPNTTCYQIDSHPYPSQSFFQGTSGTFLEASLIWGFRHHFRQQFSTSYVSRTITTAIRKSLYLETFERVIENTRYLLHLERTGVVFNYEGSTTREHLVAYLVELEFGGTIRRFPYVDALKVSRDMVRATLEVADSTEWEVASSTEWEK
ncbi:hypothetical protein WAI453_008211 [Rhynchosporium graminicola]